MSSLSLCFVVAASIGSKGGGEPLAVPSGTGTAPPPGAPAVFAWGDVDGDGKLELAAVSAEGVLQLLAPAGADRFEDVSERVGLAGITEAALAFWVDYDVDGRLDLFVGARAGASRLFRNEGGTFIDMTAAAGLATEGAVRSVDWLDHDGDGRADLHVVTAERHEVYRTIEGGFFERVALPLAGANGAGGPDVVVAGESADDPAPAPAPSSEPGDTSTGAWRSRPEDGVRSAGGRVPLGPSPTAGNPTPILVFPSGCATSIQDQSNPGACLGAATTPALGKLYPLSSNLFVAVSGEVGIGTTSPAAKLDVAGTARITDTLTLSPSGDQALAITAGSIYKDGALFLHNKGNNNVGAGRDALSSVTSGSRDTALGRQALRDNTTGSDNTAVGSSALQSNTTGIHNTAVGTLALSANTTGYRNVAIGSSALRRNTTGSYNTASGSLALDANTTGSRNTASGFGSLFYNTIGHDNTASGTYSLRDNSTGSYNTASGSDALRSNTAGGGNTAVGHHALRSNTTGFSNTAVGSWALKDNTTGSNNTASGNYALYYNTTGSYNTATGRAALSYNTTGNDNTAVGGWALLFNTTGSKNTATGRAALSSNTTGGLNTASGFEALRDNTTGFQNTATGYRALRLNTTGYQNTASGLRVLYNNTTGNRNTAIGAAALFNNTTGSANIAIGPQAGQNLTTGNDNIAIGNVGVAGDALTIRIGRGSHTRAFLGGVRGATTGVADAIPVMVDSAGQLGTVSSSRRFKEEIADMGELTERLLALRPVTFRYKPEVQQGERPLEYGLIAEEVAEVFPDLVVYDEEGQPFTVKYHLLSSMLLNELQRLREEHGRELDDLRERLALLEQERRDIPARSAR